MKNALVIVGLCSVATAVRLGQNIGDVIQENGEDCIFDGVNCTRPCHQAFLNDPQCDINKWLREYDPADFNGRIYPDFGILQSGPPATTQIYAVTAFQIDTYTPLPYDKSKATNAIDGDSSACHWNWNVGEGNSLQHTQSASDAWWTADMGTSVYIAHIDVHNRLDSCCINRLANYVVYVGDSDDYT